MEHIHIATNESITPMELQKRLDNHFDFKCNECGKSIGSHVCTFADGIFCERCRQKCLDLITKL